METTTVRIPKEKRDTLKIISSVERRDIKDILSELIRLIRLIRLIFFSTYHVIFGCQELFEENLELSRALGTSLATLVRNQNQVDKIHLINIICPKQKCARSSTG